VVISVTEFAMSRARDLPAAYVAAARLRRAWPGLSGAVGLWLWAEPTAKRSGAVSVWQSEEDLGRFVSWPVHVAIMHRFRAAGTLSSVVWAADRFVAEHVWREAAGRLRAGLPARAPGAHR
jgi:hypothetical protein